MIPRSIRGSLFPLLAASFVLAAPPAAAQRGDAIPADTVVRARLDETLSSRSSRIGEQVTATVVDEDRSGFPIGTKLEGTVTEVQRASADRPGVLDMDFRSAILPDGRRVPIEGQLASLAEDEVRRTPEGRLESRGRGGDGKFDAKWVGYGAAGGAVLSTILGGGLLKGALLGGLGGAVYGYLNKDKNRNGGRYRDVEVSRGTDFGVRLERRVAFDRRPDYRFADRLDDADADRVRVAPADFRFDEADVRVNGRAVRFTDARPMNINGSVYVPLRPIAEAANMRFNHRLGDQNFTLTTRAGAVRGYAGDALIPIAGRDERLDQTPLAIDGEIYVPTEFLSRVAEMDVRWDRRTRRLDLETYGSTARSDR